MKKSSFFVCCLVFILLSVGCGNNREEYIVDTLEEVASPVPTESVEVSPTVSPTINPIEFEHSSNENKGLYDYPTLTWYKVDLKVGNKIKSDTLSYTYQWDGLNNCDSYWETTIPLPSMSSFSYSFDSISVYSQVARDVDINGNWVTPEVYKDFPLSDLNTNGYVYAIDESSNNILLKIATTDDILASPIMVVLVFDVDMVLCSSPVFENNDPNSEVIINWSDPEYTIPINNFNKDWVIRRSCDTQYCFSNKFSDDGNKVNVSVSGFPTNATVYYNDNFPWVITYGISSKGRNIVDIVPESVVVSFKTIQ